MKVVSENSDHDLARERARTDVEWAAREMTANLLRIVRGAGKPNEVGQQAQAFVQALLNYQEVVGTFLLSDDLSKMLFMEQDSELLAEYEERDARRALAQRQVIRGALQIASSRLVKQPAQEQMGKRDLHEAINEIVAIREEARREMAASTAGAKRRAPPTRRRKPKD